MSPNSDPSDSGSGPVLLASQSDGAWERVSNDAPAPGAAAATRRCSLCLYQTGDDHTVVPKVAQGPSTCDLCRLISRAVLAFRNEIISTSQMPELEGAAYRRVNNNPGSYCVTYVMGEIRFSLDIVYIKQDGEIGQADGEYFWAEEITQLDYMDHPKSAKGESVLHSVKLAITTPLGQMLPWAGFETRSEPAPTSRDPQCFEKIRAWIRECETGHPDCETSRSNLEDADIWPRRLVDTGPLDAEPLLRLVEDVTNVEYCALSYCWGPDPSRNMTTTVASYHQRKRQILMSDLPQALQDAVVISREVGCRYLWIDSLCIVQQDRSDWESESPRMHLIYGNAYLVIAATTSASPDQSIFTDRHPAAKFDFSCGGVEYAVTVREEQGHTGSGPLNGRAWTFQERLLAKRVVHYTPNELKWECKTSHRCECSELNYGGFNPALAEALNSTTDVKTLGALWAKVVSEYSRRKLTVPGDVLPALSGLARKFARPELGKYLAGIWSSQLPDALSWRCKTGKMLKRHAAYQAPSWSWASVESGSGVQFFNGAPLLKLIAAECTPSGQDPFGQVSDGCCIVEGEFGPKKYGSTGLQEDDIWALKIGFSDWNLWHSLLLKRSSRVPGAWEMLGQDVAGDYCFEGRGKSIVKIV